MRTRRVSDMAARYADRIRGRREREDNELREFNTRAVNDLKDTFNSFAVFLNSEDFVDFLDTANLIYSNGYADLLFDFLKKNSTYVSLLVSNNQVSYINYGGELSLRVRDDLRNAEPHCALIVDHNGRNEGGRIISRKIELNYEDPNADIDLDLENFVEDLGSEAGVDVANNIIEFNNELESLVGKFFAWVEETF